MGEKVEKNLSQSVQRKPSILLDRNDLKQLTLLRRFESCRGFADPRKGLSIPNHSVDDDLRLLLHDLTTSGRVRVSNETPRNILAPNKAGNTVVRPTIQDESVLAAFTDVNPQALSPVLDLADQLGSALKSFNIFPNYSAKTLKGVAVELNPSAEKWWRNFAAYDWPMGRGLITVALPVGVDEFIDGSEKILSLVDGIGRTSGRMIKYIRFFYSDQDKRVFMVMSAGPSKDEREDISNQIKNIHKPSKARELMKKIENAFSERRRNIATHINQNMGLIGCPEEVSEATYVTLDIDRGMAVSGGVGLGTELLPFSMRDDGLIIYRDSSHEVHPLGMNRAETKKPVPKFFSQASIVSWTDSLKDSLVLKDLVVGYHPKE